MLLLCNIIILCFAPRGVCGRAVRYHLKFAYHNTIIRVSLGNDTSNVVWHAMAVSRDETVVEFNHYTCEYHDYMDVWTL